MYSRQPTVNGSYQLLGTEDGVTRMVGTINTRELAISVVDLLNGQDEVHTPAALAAILDRLDALEALCASIIRWQSDNPTGE